MESMNSEPIIPLIFSGYNPRAVLAFLRKLSSLGVERYHILAASPEDEILATKYKSHVSYIRKIKALNIDEIVSCIDALLGINETGLIIPSTEALNRFVLQHRDIFQNHKCIVPLTTEKTYLLLSDKLSFWSLCQEKGIPVPKRIKAGAAFNRPFVIKPDTYMLHDKTYKPILVKNQLDFEKYKSVLQIDGMKAYEYIANDSYYLMMYISQRGEIKIFYQKNLLQQPQGGSIIAAIPWTTLDVDMEKQYIQILHELEFAGFVMIELRKQDNTYYMIEANPRMWGPSQLLVDAETEFFETFLKDYGVIDSFSHKPINMEAKYYWGNGLENLNEPPTYLNGGEQIITTHIEEFRLYDIYNRSDTVELYQKE